MFLGLDHKCEWLTVLFSYDEEQITKWLIAWVGAPTVLCTGSWEQCTISICFFWPPPPYAVAVVRATAHGPWRLFIALFLYAFMSMSTQEMAVPAEPHRLLNSILNYIGYYHGKSKRFSVFINSGMENLMRKR